MEHRQDIGRTRGLFKNLLGEIEKATSEKGVFEMVLDQIAKLMATESDENARQLLGDKLDDITDGVRKLTSVGGRIDNAKKLTEILEKLIRMEREAFGISDAEDERTGVDDLVIKLRALRNGAQ